MTRRLTLRFRTALAATALVPLFAGLVPSTAAQTTQRQLAEQLLESGPTARRAALDQARGIRPENRGRELREALILALEREAEFLRRRDQAIRKGAFSEEIHDPVFISNAAEMVAQLRDVRAIPGLAAAVGSGAPAMRALVEFGEQSAPSVIAVVRSSDTPPESVQSGLLVLRFLVEGERLSGVTLQEITRATAERLTGRQFTAVLWRAIDLSIALKDPRLRSVVERIAKDGNEVRARSVTEIDLQLVQRTQQLAANRLAGAPAIPDRVQWLRSGR